ncbi:translation initiation factor SUI1-domain-containing protein [Mycena maculata]|uniref:Translation initiation factor SUI1-domain-containing protein n=1 Tax=Mycena maculata TaxID=230809 RepID=A0AAD7NDI7_9AGAR|nr:translation initiation factor SUI1-domain-containing protein [Mycena maculata]
MNAGREPQALAFTHPALRSPPFSTLPATEYDAKKLPKAFKKEFACSGILVDDEMGQVIQLQGDQRAKISTFLTENGMEKTTIKVHGF